MAWRVEISRTAAKQVAKLDRQTQELIIRYLRERIEASADLHQFGKALLGEKKGLRRYRIRDYRLVCDIRDAEKTVHLLSVGHRKDIYR